MLSDWHVGLGAGRPGDIDRMVQRDQDGLPYIPAKTITGIWRDACERVAWGLDSAQKGPWHQWVDYLFGEQPAPTGEVANGLARSFEGLPRPAALSIRAAHFDSNLRQAVQHKPLLLNGFTLIKPGISIDAKTGCAKPDFLRMEEMVRGGSVLTAEGELSLIGDAEQQRTAFALLVAGAMLVERIGGKRRRGAGLCKMKLVTNTEEWLNWIESHIETVPKVPEAPTPQLLTLYSEQDFASDAVWVKLPLQITAKSPLIIPAQTIGNVVKTLDYIPGTYLLQLMGRKLQQQGIKFDAALSQGHLIVTNGTVILQNQTTRPIPFSLFYKKVGGGLKPGRGVYNYFFADSVPPETQLKQYRKGYIATDQGGQLPVYGTVDLGVATHNVIADRTQRPTAEVGGIYSYQTIPANTRFYAELRCPQSLIQAWQQEDWQSVLNDDYRLGQSKKDDYGNIQLQVGEFTEIETSNDFSENLATLSVWLLSDMLLRDQWLRPTTSVCELAKQLAEALDGTGQIQLEAVKSFVGQQRRESWQTRWGLPRPSLVGLKAGSCFVFQVKGKLQPQTVHQLTIQGLGERRAEGYGQLCFEDPLLKAAMATWKKDSQDQEDSQAGKLAASGAAVLIQTPNSYARILERAVWKQEIYRQSLQVASQECQRQNVLGQLQSKKPSLSQLSSFRTVCGQLRSNGSNGCQGVLKWIAAIEPKDWSDNEKDWQEHSRPKLEALIKDANRVWDLLEFTGEKLSQRVLTTDGATQLKQELWAEAVRTLIDSCIRAHQRSQENQPLPQSEEHNGTEN